MAYSINPGAAAAGAIAPELSAALDVAGAVYASFGKSLVVTFTRDGLHMAGSLHPRGYAADLRITELGGQASAVVAALKAQLGPAYDVVLEIDHIHVEYDPEHNGGRNLPDVFGAPAWPLDDAGGGLDPGAVFGSPAGSGGDGLAMLSAVPTGLYVAVGAMLFGLVAVALFRRD